ncbi:hypothetical protein DKG77_07485 [Flagellimonas aquimarina]|uniref:DUF3857 domain-containing protein n=1 Tax=Flagellimonas aquimarina TaxID=2201895 RepID=A0A316KWE9_9FLAO|nr:DUF3857 domain-containing protein [Allomuricauda koreensis]PWL38124.1 hypothetical protein DKG77_07485 [Allomuricauda koreensis]
MDFKKIVQLLFYCCFLVVNGQKDDEFGSLTSFEKNFETYEKDSTANAIVLFEKGKAHFEVLGRKIRLIKEYHVKIKILKKEGFDEANISIPYYHKDRLTEIVEKINAITHNGDSKSHVLENKIYTSDISENRSEKKFTFPNVQEGSILEYEYKLITPYMFNLTGWVFQSDIPKISSEFTAEIPGNYVYNRTLIGSLKLDINESILKKNCFHIEGYAKTGDCEVVKYGMKNIPAFKEAENYMLAPSNYISKIEFELSEFKGFDGVREKYTKTWKDVDKEFRADKNIGRQLSKNSYFEKNVPLELFNEPDDLKRAKKIYEFTKSYFTWNKKYSIHQNSRVKDAFEKRTGSVGEINLSLINLLNASNIKAEIMLMSTREKGVPKKTHPVMSDFNYLVAKTEINGVSYLLDATDKEIPFGMLPYRCLNLYGRVMDFKNGSYWHDIQPEEKNRSLVRGMVSLDLENQIIEGSFNTIQTGYYAVKKRKDLEAFSNEEYLLGIEDSFANEVTISDYQLQEKISDEKTVSERYKFKWQIEKVEDKLYLNPFFIKFFTKNPFILEKHNYPIDFGYNRNFKYQMHIKVPEGYSLKNLPQNSNIVLGDDSGHLRLLYEEKHGLITILFDFSIKKSHYPPDYYSPLQEIFKNAVNVQKNSLIVLEKI